MKSHRFVIEFTNERIISPSGLAIVGGMLGKSELVKRLNRIPVDERKRSEPQIKNGDIALTYIGLLWVGPSGHRCITAKSRPTWTWNVCPPASLPPIACCWN